MSGANRVNVASRASEGSSATVGNGVSSANNANHKECLMSDSLLL